MRPVEDALDFAEERHGGQKYGDEPYIYHLKGVVDTARILGLSEEEQVECALHDVVEDDKASVLQVGEKFGHDVAAVVLFLARNPEETYDAYIVRVATSPAARRVKLCDLLFNHRECGKDEKHASLRIRYERAIFYLASHPTVGIVPASAADGFLGGHRFFKERK